MDKTRTVLTWIIFTVIFGITPIAVNWIYLRTMSRPGSTRPTDQPLFGKGTGSGVIVAVER